MMNTMMQAQELFTGSASNLKSLIKNLPVLLFNNCFKAKEYYEKSSKLNNSIACTLLDLILNLIDFQ